MTASWMRLPASLSGTTRWISSRETYAPLTPTSHTRLTASRRRSITPAVWRGVPARAGGPDYTGLDVIIVRGEKIAALYVFLNSMP